MIVGMVIAGFVVVGALVIGLYIRRRNMSFEGTVTDKDIREETVTNTGQNQPSGITFGNNNGGLRHVYTIKVQTTVGKSLNWQVSEGKYQIINIGDKVMKRSGTTDIEVTAKTQPTAQPTPTASPTAPTSTIVG